MVPTQIKRIYGPPLRPVAFSNFVTRMIAICSPMTLCRIISCISQFAPFQPVNQFMKKKEIKTCKFAKLHHFIRFLAKI